MASLLATPPIPWCHSHFKASSRSKFSSCCTAINPFSISNKGQKFMSSSSTQFLKVVSMKERLTGSRASSVEELQVGATTLEEEYALQAELLQEFTNIPNIDRAWVFKSNGYISKAMFSISQINLLANRKRTLILSSYILKKNKDSISFEWSPFPIEMLNASAVIPAPSGSKLLVVRNKENGSSTVLEIWGSSWLEREIHVPRSVHGPLYTDRWFEGISWNHDETLIAYVAEEPSPSKPVFVTSGYKKDDSFDSGCGNWQGQGDWEDDWGETYTGKRKPLLFVVNIISGEVRPVEGIETSLSVGQVVWAPSSSNNGRKYLVFVGWRAEVGPDKVSRKLGMKVCYNRPCALYAIRAPFQEADAKNTHSTSAVNLTPGVSSAFFPRFSPDGKFLVFLSAKTAIDSGAHSVTKSLHRMDWTVHGEPMPPENIVDVVPVVMCPNDGCFPGLYCSTLLRDPWLSDGQTMVLSSAWYSTQVILAIDIMSCRVLRVSPNSIYSWDVLSLDGDNIVALSSSPIDPPLIKYGYHTKQIEQDFTWDWLDVSNPLRQYSEKVRSLLPLHKFNVLKIPGVTSNILSEGAAKPFEAIFISSNSSYLEESDNNNQKSAACNPMVVLIHGGPHSITLTNYSKTAAFLSSLGYNLLMVNYRGSVGFGEEALQSLPGNIGCQDVNDVLAAIDYLVGRGLADASKVAVYGSSHGGFLTSHLIGQAPNRFAVAAVRNPVCNLSLMVGTSDIPDWCYNLAFGKEGKNIYSEVASVESLCLFHQQSPIFHVSKVKVPVLFLLGARDRRVPVSNGLQFARALREKGVEVKVLVFPEDGHVNFRPQSDFEGLLNLGLWFRKYCK